MATILERGIRKIVREAHYKARIVENLVKRMAHGAVQNKYLFILSPPFCGSTLISELLSTSPNLSTNNEMYTREGQRLPGVMKIMYEDWDETSSLNWAYIKNIWRQHWDVTKPILLEKSPPNIVRAVEIEQQFQPAYFLCNSRNPYAHCESLMRMSAHNRVPEVAARFAIRCLKYQQYNLGMLENVLHISYEQLTDDPVRVKEKVEAFLPELRGIDTQQEFSAHNYLSKKMKITNLNKAKINKLGQEYLDRINRVFREHRDLLAAFDYEIIESLHTLRSNEP